jgi:hypothetical protein
VTRRLIRKTGLPAVAKQSAGAMAPRPMIRWSMQEIRHIAARMAR